MTASSVQDEIAKPILVPLNVRFFDDVVLGIFVEDLNFGIRHDPNFIQVILDFETRADEGSGLQQRNEGPLIVVALSLGVRGPHIPRSFQEIEGPVCVLEEDDARVDVLEIFRKDHADV